MAKRNTAFYKDYPQSKRCCNFDITDKNFEEFTRGFVPENAHGDTQKCVRLFMEWRNEKNEDF